MEEKNYLSNIENSNKNIFGGKIKPINFKIDIRKVLANKLKSKIYNPNNSQLVRIIRRPTDSKNSQTILRNYDYDLNQIIKSKNKTESLNSCSSNKVNTSNANDIFFYKIDKIKKKSNEKYKTMKLFYKKSKSLKSIYFHNSLEFDEKDTKKIFINKYKTIKQRKTIIQNDSNQANYQTNKNLSTIGIDFLNSSNTYNTIKNNDRYKSNKIKIDKKNHIHKNISKNSFNSVNNYSSPDININKNIFQNIIKNSIAKHI